MGCLHNLICCRRLHRFAISLLVLVVSTSSQVRLLNVEGRKLAETADNPKRVVKEENGMLRGEVGSRPPRCDRRCGSCTHCEAIQVPTNPPINKNSPTLFSAIDVYAKTDGSSNYKPMSWKCKCGDLIFNP